MNNAKKLKKAAELSANDVLAKQFIDLTAKKKKIQEKLDELTKHFKHLGTKNFKNYMVIVETKPGRRSAMSAARGTEIYGEGFVKNMKIGKPFEILTVKKKVA